MSRIKTINVGKMMVVAILVGILASALCPSAVFAGTGSPPTNSGTIEIKNGTIDINVFGETGSGTSQTGTGSWVWFYPPGVTNVYDEHPAFSYGSNLPVPLMAGTVVQYYPATGVTNTWYSAKINLDLDRDGRADIQVIRSIMVPSGQKFFYVKYEFKSITGRVLRNFRFFQGVDYDIGPSYTNDEAGYTSDLHWGFVWTHDMGDTYHTWAGFMSTDSRLPTHHSVDYWTSMWTQVNSGVLNNADYFGSPTGDSDPGVALEWDLWALIGTGHLTLKFAFADSYPELSSLLLSR